MKSIQNFLLNYYFLFSLFLWTCLQCAKYLDSSIQFVDSFTIILKQFEINLVKYIYKYPVNLSPEEDQSRNLGQL